MKKKILIAALFLFCFIFTACGSSAVKNDLSAVQVLDSIVEKAGIEIESMGEVDKGRAENENLSSVDFAAVDSYKILASTVSTSLNEIGVLKATSNVDALYEQVKQSCEAGKGMKITYADYLPEEYKKVENYKVTKLGNYVLYQIIDTDSMNAVQTAFENTLK